LSEEVRKPAHAQQPPQRQKKKPHPEVARLRDVVKGKDEAIAQQQATIEEHHTTQKQLQDNIAGAQQRLQYVLNLNQKLVTQNALLAAVASSQLEIFAPETRDAVAQITFEVNERLREQAEREALRAQKAEEEDENQQKV